MIRLTKKVFIDLALWMIGLGLVMGVVFPFFTVLMGVPAEKVMTPQFFGACMAAGFIVGAANIGLARNVVGKKLRLLAERMGVVEGNLQQMASGEDPESCAPEECHIEIDSDDEIGHTSQAFNNLVDALADSHRNQAAVREFTTLLASNLELEALTGQALERLIDSTSASAGALLIEEEGELKIASVIGIRDSAALVDSDHVRRAIRSQTRQQVVVPDDVAVEGVLSDFRPREVLVEPVIFKSVPLGVIVLASAGDFGVEAASRLELFGQGLALAMNNALVHDRLQRLAALDPLTGLYNRRFGMARLHEEFQRSVRGGSPLGVVMLDIDHFKQVNDTYGHLVGDRVLIQTARLVRTVMREGDILVRYGGEEFLAILPAAAREDALQVAERLRRLVEESSVKDGDQIIRVTISAGVSAFPDISVDKDEELVQLADQSLYTAKEGGRNRVVVA